MENKYSEKFLKQLEDTAIAIMKRAGETGVLSESDLAFITLYKKEIKKREHVPMIDAALSSVKKLTEFVNSNINSGGK